MNSAKESAIDGLTQFLQYLNTKSDDSSCHTSDDGNFGDYDGDCPVDDGNFGDYDGDCPCEPPTKPKGSAKHSSKSCEWYTPEDILNSARLVLDGYIDFDPFSCAEANEAVNAEWWLGEETDGFNLDVWPNCGPITIWCNPPGGKVANKSKAALAWANLMKYQDSGRLESALFMAFSIESLQVTQKGYHSVSMMHFPLCVPSKRLKHRAPKGKKAESPTHAQAIIYVPGTVDRTDIFMQEFSKYGVCKA
jgi:hypothetical protein